MKNTSSELTWFCTLTYLYVNIFCKKLKYKIRSNFSKDIIRPPLVKKYNDNIKCKLSKSQNKWTGLLSFANQTRLSLSEPLHISHWILLHSWLKENVTYQQVQSEPRFIESSLVFYGWFQNRCKQDVCWITELQFAKFEPISFIGNGILL